MDYLCYVITSLHAIISNIAQEVIIRKLQAKPWPRQKDSWPNPGQDKKIVGQTLAKTKR